MVGTATGSDAARLSVDCLTTPSALGGLSVEWDQLWAAAGQDTTVFQSRWWLSAWWTCFADGELRIVTVRDGARLVGLVPLFLSTSSTGGREIRMLGVGVSDYLDLLAVPGGAPAVAQALAGYLETGSDDWTFCALDHLPSESALLHVAVHGAAETRRGDPPCPVLMLPSTVALMNDTMDRRLAANLKLARRRSRHTGDVTLEHATRSTVQDLLTTLFELHALRWNTQGATGMLASPAVRAFHRMAAPELLSAGALRLFALRIGADIAAVYYGFQAAGRAYAYIGGFHPAFASMSPGTLAIAAAIELAIADGASTFDFLAGQERYKYQWRAVDSLRTSRHFRRLSARGADRPGDAAC